MVWYKDIFMFISVLHSCLFTGFYSLPGAPRFYCKPKYVREASYASFFIIIALHVLLGASLSNFSNHVYTFNIFTNVRLFM